MVKITKDNGKSILTVSKGAFRAFYKGLGYTEYKEQARPNNAPKNENSKVEANKDEQTVKPLSELTVKELRKIAEEKKIDLGKLTKKDDIIAKIMEANKDA